MRNRALLSALALCFIAAGCDSKPAASPQPKAAAAVTPLPPPAPTAPAASAGQDAKASEPAQVAQTGVTKQAVATTLKDACKNTNNCTITLTVTGTTSQNCNITKDRPELHVAKGRPETVHWKINNTPGGLNWDFDTNGIDFRGNALFTCSSNGANKYKCDDKNPETTKTPHRYYVRLKAGSVTCDKDPMIVNGAPDQNQEP